MGRGLASARICCWSRVGALRAGALVRSSHCNKLQPRFSRATDKSDGTATGPGHSSSNADCTHHHRDFGPHHAHAHNTQPRPYSTCGDYFKVSGIAVNPIDCFLSFANRVTRDTSPAVRRATGRRVRAAQTTTESQTSRLSSTPAQPSPAQPGPVRSIEPRPDTRCPAAERDRHDSPTPRDRQTHTRSSKSMFT